MLPCAGGSCSHCKRRTCRKWRATWVIIFQGYDSISKGKNANCREFSFPQHLELLFLLSTHCWFSQIGLWVVGRGAPDSSATRRLQGSICQWLGRGKGVPHLPSCSPESARSSGVHGGSARSYGVCELLVWERTLRTWVSRNTAPSGGQEEDSFVTCLPLKVQNLNSDPSIHAKAGVVVWLSKSSKSGNRHILESH